MKRTRPTQHQQQDEAAASSSEIVTAQRVTELEALAALIGSDAGERNQALHFTRKEEHALNDVLKDFPLLCQALREREARLNDALAQSEDLSGALTGAMQALHQEQGRRKHAELERDTWIRRQFAAQSLLWLSWMNGYRHGGGAEPAGHLLDTFYAWHRAQEQRGVTRDGHDPALLSLFEAARELTDLRNQGEAGGAPWWAALARVCAATTQVLNAASRIPNHDETDV